MAVFFSFPTLFRRLFRHFLCIFSNQSAFAIAKAVDVPVYTVEQGAATLVYACTSADPDLLAGYHFKDCTRQAFGRKAENPGLQKELWDVSVKLAGVQPIITSRM